VDGHHEEAHDHSERGGGGSTDPSQDRIRLSTSATVHCLAGCGLGEVVGVVIGVAIVLAVVFGFALGLIPLSRAGFSRPWAIRQVLVAEGLSIVVMETAEVLVECYTPGVMQAGLASPLFWGGDALGANGRLPRRLACQLLVGRKGHPAYALNRHGAVDCG
jgi:hypothetical protein